MKRPLILIFLLTYLHSQAQQQQPSTAAVKWADSVFRTLSDDQKIAQLMIVRMSATDGKNVTFYEQQVRDAVLKYNVGGICLFQGGPLKQASLVNDMQKIAKTPLLISIDGENGLGMRMDSVMPLPRQMMMGAISDPSLIYEYGRLVGEQCRRAGIQVNYAPVVDINNNPANPVINDRSFGEDKYRVAMFGIQYMRGMQDVGVMAVAKHFPGHGDVSVDSHLDLPVINKSRAELDSLELYPFRQMVNAGVGGVMVAHLSIPSIDDGKNAAASLSYNNVTGLLRNELGFNGLVFTDALEMKGVAKYYPAGEISAKALEAGNDMLCLPGDIPGSIKKIREAVKKKDLSWGAINEHVKKVLLVKYQYGLANLKPVELDGLTEDLNARSAEMRRLIAQRAITVLRNDNPEIFPLPKGKRVAYLGIGVDKDNAIADELRKEYDAHIYYFDYQMADSMVAPMLGLLHNRYDVVVIGVHHYSRFPGKDFGISAAADSLVAAVQNKHKAITIAFGNPYALKIFDDSRNLIACYEDDSITQQTAADLLQGRFTPKGRLPVTVSVKLPSGSGIVSERLMSPLRPSDLGFRISTLTSIDSIVNDAIAKRAIPGAVVLVAKDGRIAYERAFGYMGYDSLEPVYPETIYDMASVTKIMATTLSVMKLYDEGKLSLHSTLGDYLSWTRGTNKASLPIWDVLLHQAGLKAWIPFYRETLDTAQSEAASMQIYAAMSDSTHPVRVADHIFMRRDWTDTIFNRILQSNVTPVGSYIYSDLDFIFLGKIVEKLTGMPLDQYVRKTFYEPLGLRFSSFKPREHFPLQNIAPTETEPIFRKQTIRGDVHDPGAAMFGGVAGHAGLFSTAYDIAVLGQMLLNKGKMNGVTFFKKGTVDLFTAYHSEVSRRGLGFDKPERDNYSRVEPYPTASASPLTFGHTGFTGTCVWMDPEYNLTFVFLSNRVYANGDMNRFLRMNVRPKVHETIYKALGITPATPGVLTTSLH